MCYDHACTHFTRTLYTPVQEKLVESLEVGVAACDLRPEVVRPHQVLHVSQDQTLLLRCGLHGDRVQHEGVEGRDGAGHVEDTMLGTE